LILVGIKKGEIEMKLFDVIFVVILILAIFCAIGGLFYKKNKEVSYFPCMGEGIAYHWHYKDFEKYSDLKFEYSDSVASVVFELSIPDNEIRLYNNCGGKAVISFTDSVRYSGTLSCSESAKIFFNSLSKYYQQFKEDYNKREGHKNE
jgi:hypothetical protein